MKYLFFEADIKFKPIEPKTPLFVEKMPFDERKIINAMKIICGLNSGSVSWIPEKYLSNNDPKLIQDLETMAAQIALGKAVHFLNQKDYMGLSLHINACLLSKYLKNNPQYMVRFLEKQAEGFTGLNNYAEAKKSILRIMEYDKNFSFEFYFGLACSDYKLGNKNEAINNFEKFINAASLSMTSLSEIENKRNKELIEVSRKLINKLNVGLVKKIH